MIRRLFFAYPGDIGARTGGYGYDRRIMAALGEQGWTVRPVPLGDGFPEPSPPQRAAAEAALSHLPDGSLVLIDGLAFGTLDGWARRESRRLRIVALVHHPLALETGLDERRRAAFLRREAAALACACGVVTTSRTTAAELAARYGVPAERIAVATPGVDQTPFAAVRDGRTRILSVGTLIRRKGHDVLVRALEDLRDLPWDCRIVGSRALDAEVVAGLDAQIAGAGLGGRVRLAGEVEDIGREFAEAGVFALASRYEGYGMVFAEALVHGLPIVACAAGAVPEVVPEATGFLVPPDDPPAFARALRRLLTEPETRAAAAQASAAAGAALPSWRDSAAILSAFLETRP